MFDTQNNRIELARDREGRLLQARLLNPDGSVSQRRDFAAQDDAAAAAPGRDGVMDAMRELVANAADSGNIARPDLLQAMRTAQDALSGAGGARPQGRADVADASGAYTHYYRDDFNQLRRVESRTSPCSSTTRPAAC